MTCSFIITLNKNIDRVENTFALGYPCNYFSAAVMMKTKYLLHFVLKIRGGKPKVTE